MANTVVRLNMSLEVNAKTWNMITSCLNNVVVDDELCNLKLDEKSPVPLTRWLSQNVYLGIGDSNVISVGFNGKIVVIDLSDLATVTVRYTSGHTATMIVSSLLLRSQYIAEITIADTENIVALEGKVLVFGDENVPIPSSSSSSS